MAFLPHKILAGARLLARYIQRNFEAIEAKFPVRASDIASFYMERAIWGRARVPTSALDLDEIFNNSTDGMASLGTMDMRRGMRLVYVSPTTFAVQPGFVMHRGMLKVQSVTDCDTGCGDALTPGALLIPGECQDTEGNPSGLDYGGSGTWYYVYAKLDVGGTAPEYRVSLIEPTRCDGKGWEHPSYTKLRYLGCLKTLPSGELRPWAPADNGWTYWMQSDTATDDQSAGYLREGRNGLSPTGGWVTYEEAITGDAYHDGPRHIPPTADAIRVDFYQTRETDQAKHVQVRPMGATGEGHGLQSGNGGHNGCEVVLPVNMCSLEANQKQRFEYKANGGNDDFIDVAGYYEDI